MNYYLFPNWSLLFISVKLDFGLAIYVSIDKCKAGLFF